MLRERCAVLEDELARLRADVAERDASLAERFTMLWPTSDPDVRQCRAHQSADFFMIPVALGVTALVLAGFASNACFVCAGLAVVTLQIRSLRTAVDRRRRAFAIRFPWSPRALQTKHPIGELSVQKHVKSSKGRKTITYEVVSGGRVVADGMSQERAERLAVELRDFLGEPSQCSE